MTDRRNYPNPRRDEFAELLSQDLPRDAIKERMGLNDNGFKSHLKKLRDQLGWQAR